MESIFSKHGIKLGDYVRYKYRKAQRPSHHNDEGEGVVRVLNDKFISIETKKGYPLAINHFELVTGEVKLTKIS